MALAVCLVFDPPADRAIRQLWDRLESEGVSTLATHTHRHHVPHLSYAVLREFDVTAVRAAVEALPAHEPLRLHFDGVGLFRRGRAVLLPSAGGALQGRQSAVVAACEATGADLHRHYRPGTWIPHSSLATRVRRDDLGSDGGGGLRHPAVGGRRLGVRAHRQLHRPTVAADPPRLSGSVERLGEGRRQSWTRLVAAKS